MNRTLEIPEICFTRWPPRACRTCGRPKVDTWRAQERENAKGWLRTGKLEMGDRKWGTPRCEHETVAKTCDTCHASFSSSPFFSTSMEGSRGSAREAAEKDAVEVGCLCRWSQNKWTERDDHCFVCASRATSRFTRAYPCAGALLVLSASSQSEWMMRREPKETPAPLKPVRDAPTPGRFETLGLALCERPTDSPQTGSGCVIQRSASVCNELSQVDEMHRNRWHWNGQTTLNPNPENVYEHHSVM